MVNEVLVSNLPFVGVGRGTDNSITDTFMYFYVVFFYALDLEWMFGQVGAIASELEENPRKQIHDVMQSTIRSTTQGGDDDEDDW